MKHSAECVNLWTDELVALCTIAGIAIPQSIQDKIARWPTDPAGVQNAQARAKAKLTRVLLDRADTRTDYVWPYPAQPPTWTKAPMQVQAQAPLSVESQRAGIIIPPAPWAGVPNPTSETGGESDGA